MEWLRLLGITPPTIVHIRSTSKGRSPGKFWTSRVRYDAWGSPYAKAHDTSLTSLLPSGQTHDTDMYGTEWRLKSGPPVTWPSDRPATAFAEPGTLRIVRSRP